MNTNVSFRHMESSPALRDYATGKLERIVDKYVHGKIDADVVMSVEKFWHIANFTLQIKNLTVKGEESSQDMYSSSDLALDKIEKQLRRHKDRLRDYKPSQGASRPFQMAVLSPGLADFDHGVEDDEALLEESSTYTDDYDTAPPATAAAAASSAATTNGQPAASAAQPAGETYDGADGHQVKLVRKGDYEARAMDLNEAVIQLDLLEGRQFFVFTNVDTDTINIIYRRDDGNFGLIET